jgi:hypothetical protein
MTGTGVMQPKREVNLMLAPPYNLKVYQVLLYGWRLLEHPSLRNWCLGYLFDAP